MVRVDRYILSQLMGPFGFFSLVLIGIYWLNRALGIFDQLIGDGHSVRVFLDLVVLFLPQVVLIVLPAVSFIAAVYVSNRLHSDSEIVVLLAAGMSPFRLARPFLMFGLLVALLTGALSHVLVPISLTAINDRKQELARDITSLLITEGKFLHPVEGITFFVRKIDQNGELLDIFLHDQRSESRTNTYSAQRALLLRDEGSAKLIMFDGLVQTLETEPNLLSKVHFEDFVFDMTSFVDQGNAKRITVHDFSTWQSLFPTPEILEQSGISRARFQFSAHNRIIQPLHVIGFPLIGMAALMLGGFSRFGVARQITLAVVLLFGLSLTIGPIRGIVQKDISVWPLMYAPDLAGFLIAYLMLNIAARKSRRKKAPKRKPAGGTS